MDFGQAIKDAEIALRDFLQASFEKRFGPEWPDHEMILPEEAAEWRHQKAQIESNLPPESAGESLFYHIPFEELSSLIKRFWDSDFHSAFGEYETLHTYLNILGLYRNPDIHRRALFVHQKHLILGVSGEIRAKITAFRSLQELGKNGFPRIDYIKDNFGNLWTPGQPRRVKTGVTLNPGARLEFIVEAHDPEEQPLEFKIHGEKWQPGNILIFDITERHVQKDAPFSIAIRSTRKYHAFPMGYDDRVVFEYQIIPR